MKIGKNNQNEIGMKIGKNRDNAKSSFSNFCVFLNYSFSWDNPLSGIMLVNNASCKKCSFHPLWSAIIKVTVGLNMVLADVQKLLEMAVQKGSAQKMDI